MMVTNRLDRSASLQSPFYPGNTMFGGSNAANLYRRGNSLLAEASQVHHQISNTNFNNIESVLTLLYNFSVPSDCTQSRNRAGESLE